MKHTNPSTYTPNPWEDNGNGLIYGQCSGDDDQAPFVADVCSSPDSYTEQEQANARLIEAAPELLKILKSLTDRISELEGISSVIDEDLMQGEAFKEAVALLAGLKMPAK